MATFVNAPPVVMVIALLILTVLTAGVYLPWLDYLPLYLEEPRRALIAAQMLANNNYLTPIYEGQIYLGKPPLFNWLICLSSLPIGEVTTWTARLPSVLAIWLLVLFVVTTAWDKIGSTAAIFWGLAILLSPEFLLKGRLAEIDVVFASLVTVAIWSFWLLDHDKCDLVTAAGVHIKLVKHLQPICILKWLLPLLFVALAYLTKREPAVVFFYLTVGTYLVLQGRGYEILQASHWFALLLAIIPVAIWLIAIINQAGFTALWHSLLNEVLRRGEGTSIQHYIGHVLTYPLQIVAACAPFSLLLLPLGWREFRYTLWQRHSTTATFAMVAVLVNFPLYWLKGRAAVRYFLPMFPMLLLMAALSYDTILALRSRNANWHWQQHMWPISILQWMLPVMTVCMLLLRGMEFWLYLPYKAQYLAQTHGAQRIIADIQRQLLLESVGVFPTKVISRQIFASPRVPAALWFYAPLNLMRWLPTTISASCDLCAYTNAGVHNGDLLLRHKDIAYPYLVLQKIAQYQYENDLLYLERVLLP